MFQDRVVVAAREFVWVVSVSYPNELNKLIRESFFDTVNSLFVKVAQKYGGGPPYGDPDMEERSENNYEEYQFASGQKAESFAQRVAHMLEHCQGSQLARAFEQNRDHVIGMRYAVIVRMEYKGQIRGATSDVKS